MDIELIVAWLVSEPYVIFISSHSYMKLTLRVLEACGLAHLNQHDNIYPYCLIQLTRSSQIQRTKVIDRTTNPVWNAEFAFNVRHQRDSLKIFVKDCSKFRSHSLLATVTLGMKNYKPGATIDQWFALTPVKGVKMGGQIHLTLHLEPATQSGLPILISPRPILPARRATTENEPPLIQPPAVVAVEPVPHVQTPDQPSGNASRLNLLVISGDFGDIVDTVNPNEIDTVETSFSEIRESPAKMYTADAMEMLQLEKGVPIYGPHWALAKVAAFSAHRACDYFTEFAVLGCDGATRAWVLAMKKFFSEANHDINRNRIQFAKDPAIGSLVNAIFNAYTVTIAAMASKKTLVQARKAINEAAQILNGIAVDPNEAEDYKKAEFALLKGCQSYAEREDGAFLRNLQGAKLDSLGLNAAVSALGLSSLEHSMNCYICNSFGSRIQIEAVDQISEKEEENTLRRSHSASSIHVLSCRLF
jgi:hypothetical protein